MVHDGNAPGRHRRTIALLVSLALFFLAAYPVAVNIFLARGGVQAAFKGTDTVAVDFRRAWSFWPGRVHVEGARITMKDRNVQFALAIDRAVVDVDLLAFAHHTFHATRVRGEGVSFRFRHRIEQESKDAPFVGALPPIAEFDDPPLREFGPPEAPLDEAHYNLWTVHVDDVDVGVSELWTQMMRYEGDARVVGAFRLRPAKRLWVGPAELEFRGGRLTTGAYDLLRDMRGKLTCKVDDFNVEPVRGMEPFRFISVRLELQTTVANLDAMKFLAPSPSHEISDGSGLLDMDVAIDHGVITPSTRLNYRTGHVGVQNTKLPFRLDGEIEVTASGPARGPGSQLRLAVGEGALIVATSRHRPPELRDVEIELGSSNADVTQDFPLTRSEARIGNVVLPDLAWLQDLPLGRHPSWKIQGGRGRASGFATLHQPSQAIDSSFSAGFDGATILTESAKVTGAADILATAHVSADRGATVKGRLVTDRLELATDAATASLLGRAALDADLALSPRGHVIGELRAESGEWIADVGGSRFSGAALSGSSHFEPHAITANATVSKVRTSMLGACPWADAEQATVAARVDMPDDGGANGNVIATLVGASLQWGGFQAHAAETSLLGRWDRTHFSAKLASSAIAMKNAGGPPRGWASEVASVTATADLNLGEKRAAGPARVEIRNAQGQVGKTKVRGNLLAELSVSSPTEALRTAEVSGRVQTRDVALTAGENKVEGWWAAFDLDRAKVDLRHDFDLTGKVKAQFRDGLPALYVLSSTDAIPSIVPGLVPLEGLTLQLGIERYCRWTDVQVLDARGGPLAAEGRVQIEPGETRGAILLRLAAFKPISVGLNFVEDYSSASPLVGGGWLERHLAPLTSAATEKHDQKCMPEPPTCQ